MSFETRAARPRSDEPRAANNSRPANNLPIDNLPPRQRTYIPRAETEGMDDRLERVIRQQLRKAGKQFEEAKRAYSEGKGDPDNENAGTVKYELPSDEEGRARIVCRRYAERRAIPVDSEGRPACFDADHPDCEGCAEDIRERFVETW